MESSGRQKTITLINGRIMSAKNARISVLDNALLYGEGLFETFLCVDDRLAFQEAHLQRLYRGARIIGLPVPVRKSILVDWLRATARSHPEHIKKLRLTITSGESARWTGTQGPQQVISTASPHVLQKEPFRLHVSDFRVDQDSIFRRIKTISYAIHAAALKAAQENGCDDALLVNEAGHVAEVTSANIFWVRRGRVYTPPISSGCLEGVTREAVCREARRAGFRVIEKNETLRDLLAADEIFLSSSLKLVIAVSSIAARGRTFDFESGPITRRLRERFFKLVKIA